MSNGKSSKRTTKIPYYEMSMHYGICHGPLDSINQVWVKEKLVLCQMVKEPFIAHINKPELFGGETKEGGVDGVMEAYFGTPLQKMSQAVAARFSRNTNTMVGYRGVANLFFRAYAESELQYKPAASNDTKAGLFIRAMSAAAELFNSAVAYAANGGFHWITNNPYLPATWVHVTRLPKPLGSTYAAVPQPLGGDTGDRTDQLHVNLGSGSTNTEVDVSDMAVAIDAGTCVVTLRLAATCVYTQFTSGPAPLLMQLRGSKYDENGNEITSEFGSEDEWFVQENTSGGGEITLTRTLPPGTRSLLVRGLVTATFPLTSLTTVTKRTWTTSYMTQGKLLCADEDVAVGSPFEANPAYIVAECLTNRQWGMGHPISSLDVGSFLSAAELFYGEFFGLSMLWREQMTIEKFVTEVLDHVQATLFIDPTTGLWTIKPIRGDYVASTLRVLDATNCVTTNRQRKAEGEIINEIVVEYTDFQNEGPKTVTFQDLAGIAQLGQIVSETRNYYGIRSDYLANVVGARDIRSASYPLFSCDVEADRSFRDARPGDVFRLDIPEDGIVGMVVRVAKVDYGQPGDRKVRFAVTEDIFGLPVTTYTSIQPSLWENPDRPPEPLAYSRVVEGPLPLLLRSGISAADVSDDDYPLVLTSIFANDPAQAIESISIWGDEVTPSGAVTQKVIGAVYRTTMASLTEALRANVVASEIPGSIIRAAAAGDEVISGDFYYLDGPAETGEFVMLDTYNSTTDRWTVARGMFDTIPRAWAIGHVLWRVGDRLYTLDPTANSHGVPTTFKLLPKTTGGTLSPDSADAIIHTPTARPYLPFRPANVAASFSGGGAAMTPYPIEVQNPGAETHLTLIPTLWTVHEVTSDDSHSMGSGPMGGHTGSRFFKFEGLPGSDPSMEQQLSIPVGMNSYVDDGGMSLLVRWFQAGRDSVSDPVWVEIVFYDAAGSTISIFIGSDRLSSGSVWSERKEYIPIPALARSYMLRFRAEFTTGTTDDAIIDTISVAISDGEFPVYAFTGTEVPTTMHLTWANRNRLTEDSLALRWTQGTVTPEVGQTTTIRVRERFSRSIELEVTGLTGTSYDLDLTSLVTYRFYDIEVLAERDGFESLQFFTQRLDLARTGYGNNYGYDYGQNDGA